MTHEAGRNTAHRTRLGDRFALGVALALLWINLATTGQWAGVPGALRAGRLPWMVAALAATTIAACWRPGAWWGAPRWLPRVACIGGFSVLAASILFSWLPPATWSQIPFLDDWPARYSATVDGVALLHRGALVGWQWNLLGGYATSSDITQSLTLFAALPMTLFGDAIGYHVIHVLLFLALPLLVFLDLDRSEPRRVSLLSAGLVAFSAGGLSWTAVRSGDTNSLAGLVCVAATLVASHRARTGARFGTTVLVAVLASTACAHAGFFIYAVGLLAMEALYYQSAAHVHRIAVATILAGLISLPLTYELLRFPDFFHANNVLYASPAHIDWTGIVRKIGYNTQLLWLPQRWANNPSGLTSLFLPLVLVAAWRREGRPGYYAWAALGAMAMMRFDVPEAGFVFARPVHLLTILTPVAIGWFIAARAWNRTLAWSLTAAFAIAVPIVWREVPHEPSVDAFVPKLVDQLRSRDGHLVLVEINPHRNLAAPPPGPGGEPSYYGVHFESLLPAATGKRLYAGAWDGWQWTPFRGEMLAGGAWQGHVLTAADHDAFLAELRRWGIVHLLVWSRTASTVVGSWPEFADRWSDDPWHDFEFVDPAGRDVRSVVTTHGDGELLSTQPLGGVVRLHDARAGDQVVVRTHFHPSWEAMAAGRPLEMAAVNGQLAFTAPADGSYDVELVYPTRRWLLLLSLGVILAMAVVEWRFL